MEVQQMNYLTLKDLVSKLFVHEDRYQDGNMSFYFGDTLKDNEELKTIIREAGFEIQDFYYERAYYFCDEFRGYLKNVSFPNDTPNRNTLTRIFERICLDVTPDVYTSDLIEWFSYNRLHYVDEYIKTADSLFWALTYGQRDHILEIYEIMFKVILQLGGVV